MTYVKNNTANVSSGKGVAGGYLFSAPVGTALPTDNKTALDAAFVNLGFVSEDGIAESIESDNEELRDMNGDVVHVAKSSRTETITATLIEVKKDSLAEQYGHANVTDADGLITVKHNSKENDDRVYVLELLLKDNRRWRQVVPNGKVTEVGELSIASGSVIGREVTITAATDENGNSVIDYIDSTETKVGEGE